MDKIKCPACGEEISADAENCPSCGAPIGTIKDQGISGTPIDNKEAIDNMLEKANMLVEEGRELGIEGLEEQPSEQLNGYGEEAIPGIPLSGDSGQGGNADFLEVENAPGITLFEMDESGNVITEKKPEPKKAKKQKEKKERSNNKSSYDGNGSSNKKKRKKTSGGVVFLAVIISLAVGVATGFFGKMLIFPDLPAPACQAFAEKSVKSVNSVLGEEEEIFVAEAYVKEFTSSAQCLIRTFFTKSGAVSEKWYRVKVDSADSKKIHVYTQYDRETLDSMFNSSNDEDRAKAAVLSGIQEETERLINEMRKGGDWVEVNPSLLNNSIHPYKNKN